jgi:hypothetical protein
MSGFLQMLEKQKKRERQVTFDLGNTNASGQWAVMLKCEEEALALCQMVKHALPQRDQLTRESVSLQAYEEPSAQAVVRIKTQVSALNNKKMQIKVHCHEVEPNGRFHKLYKTIYHFNRTQKLA